MQKAKNEIPLPEKANRLQIAGGAGAMLCFLAWLGIILILYWPGIIIFPQKDHPPLMLERHLAGGDFQWFLDMLSYNRTRVFAPGDYFAFRPLHLGIVALEDIFLRFDLRAQGIINCCICALAATAFFSLARRIAGNAAAAAATLLWVSQLAGAVIVLWQHITPYLLLPAGLCLAVALVTEEESSLKTCLAGAGALAASLSHETGVVISCALALFAIVPGTGKRSRRLCLVFLVPALIALSWNLLDYFLIHPVPSLMGPGDSGSGRSLPDILKTAAAIIGAAGVALLYPAGVKVQDGEGWYLSWPFPEVPDAAMMVCGGALLLLIGTSIFLFLRSFRRNGMTPLTTSRALFLLLASAVFWVLFFRSYTRGVSYLHSATYYFSLFSLAASGLAVALAASLRNRFAHIAAVAAMLLLALWQGYVLRSKLMEYEGGKRMTWEKLQAAREFFRDSPGYCFQGSDERMIPQSEVRMWSTLFSDVACSVRGGGSPLYLYYYNGALELTKLGHIGAGGRRPEQQLFSNGTPYDPSGGLLIPFRLDSDRLVFGQSIEFTLEANPDFSVTFFGDLGQIPIFRVDRNSVRQKGNEAIFVASLLTWQPGAATTRYLLAVSGDSLLLFADDRLLSVYRDIKIPPGARMLFMMVSHSGRPLKVKSFRASEGVESVLLNREVVYAR